VKLLDYRSDNELRLTDAVFEDADGRYWHWQKLESSDAYGTGSGVLIQYAVLDTRPTVGTTAVDYEQWEWKSPDGRQAKHFWFELMVRALYLARGWEAMFLTAF
jgi:hypothetical protein